MISLSEHRIRSRTVAVLCWKSVVGGAAQNRARKQAVARSVCLLLLLAAAALPLAAAVEGVVLNGTTGQPQPGVAVTLMRLEQGMEPVGTATSGAGGKFTFPEVTDAGSEPAHIMLRADFEGVTYNRVLPPGARAGDISLTVYRAVPAGPKAGAPEQHLILIEPAGAEMIVNESYLYQNNAQPPVSYVDKKQGTLRFYLPPETQGSVEVHVSGIGGVPIRMSAEKTEQAGIYKIDYPIKPGESRIDLNYRVPYQEGMTFTVRSLYPGMVTRAVAPPGVALTGEGLQSLGQHPETQASIFNVPDAESFRLTISGTGRLSRPRETEEGGQRMQIIPAPVYDRFWYIVGLAAAILMAGFYGLYTASGASATPKKRKA